MKSLSIRILLAAALSLALASCGGGGGSNGAAAEAPASAPATPSASAGWTPAPPILGACCYYASIVFTENGGVRIYTNTGSAGDGKMHLYEGSIADGVQERGPALTVTDPAEAYVRTFGVVRRNGRYHALLFTGSGYPTTNGYAPSWAESSDGVNWEFKGSVNPFGSRPFSSSMTLTVDDQGRFRAWTDEAGGTLREMSSQDGLHWQALGDVWPKSLPAGQAVFPTATRTARGTMIAVADTWPSNKIRVLWQCHGDSEFKVLEESSAIHAGQKGTTLAWDGSLIHAYVLGNHWTRPEPACP